MRWRIAYHLLDALFYAAEGRMTVGFEDSRVAAGLLDAISAAIKVWGQARPVKYGGGVGKCDEIPRLPLMPSCSIGLGTGVLPVRFTIECFALLRLLPPSRTRSLLIRLSALPAAPNPPAEALPHSSRDHLHTPCCTGGCCGQGPAGHTPRGVD